MKWRKKSEDKKNNEKREANYSQWHLKERENLSNADNETETKLKRQRNFYLKIYFTADDFTTQQKA